MISIEQIYLNNTTCNIVKFEENDFQQIKIFVLELCKGLDDNTYFITDDIDSELPLLLKEKYGLVYGIICGNKILAIQAIDYNLNKTLNFSKIFGLSEDKIFIEVGWAMVDPQFRKMNLSRHLSSLLEQAAHKEKGNEIYVATVHPKNTGSLFLFLRLGYIGVKLTCHFNVIRLVMIKKINYDFPMGFEKKSVSLKDDNYKQLEQFTQKGYVCYTAYAEQNNVFLKFVKFNFNLLIEK